MSLSIYNYTYSANNGNTYIFIMKVKGTYSLSYYML